ncbi:MAG: hypothetical protein GY726_07970 [Proteobacteria bacterium]|nr:hypothetical protein [Pseudomonadota bacterium]
MKNTVAMGSIVILVLAGCSEGSDKPGEQQNAMTSLLSTHIEAVAKAKNVEKIIQDSFNKRDQVIDAQGQ